MTPRIDRQALQRLRQRAWEGLLAGCASPGLQAAVCAHLPNLPHLPQPAALSGSIVAGKVAAEPFLPMPLRMQPVRAAQPAWQGVQP